MRKWLSAVVCFFVCACVRSIRLASWVRSTTLLLLHFSRWRNSATKYSTVSVFCDLHAKKVSHYRLHNDRVKASTLGCKLHPSQVCNGVTMGPPAATDSPLSRVHSPLFVFYVAVFTASRRSRCVYWQQQCRSGYSNRTSVSTGSRSHGQQPSPRHDTPVLVSWSSHGR